MGKAATAETSTESAIEPAAADSGEAVLDGAAQGADVTAESSTATDVAAESSAADEGVKKPGSPLEAVMAALKKSETDGESPEPGSADVDQGANKDAEGVGDGEATAAAADADDESGSEAEDAKLPFAKHPRFRQVLGQVKRFRTERDELKIEAERLRPVAKHYDELQRYVTSSGMTPEDFTNGLRIMRLMKNDPIKAYEAIKPWMDQHAELTGERLPQDIQAKLEAGTIDRDTAIELARERGKARLEEARNTRLSQQTDQERQARADEERERNVQRFVNDVGASVTAWERQWKSSDPDYAKKQPLVMDRVAVLMNKTPPKSKEDAVRLCNEAREHVTKQLASILPRKSTVTPMTGGTSVDTRPRPKTPLEVTNAALASGGG